MSGDPLLGLARDGEQGLKVVQTERGSIATLLELILEVGKKILVKNGPFTLKSPQIVDLIKLLKNLVGRVGVEPTAR